MEEKLKKMTFSKSLRGYACDEVDTYFRYVADKYEQRSRECTELRRQMALIAAKMNEYTDGKSTTAEVEDAHKKSVQETCDNMIDEAKRQAAHILADAEAEAEVIRRHAEDNAQTIAANAAREGARVVNDAARSVAARNNAADRLVEEIDSFRKEVYSLYSRHIAELDRLAARTNEFYDRKTAVAESVAEDDGARNGTANAAVIPAYAADTDADAPHTEAADAADATEEAATPIRKDSSIQMDPSIRKDSSIRMDPSIRIDWKNRTARQTHDLVIDIPDEDADAQDTVDLTGGADEKPAEKSENDRNSALDALFLTLTDKKMLTSETEQETPEETARAVYDFEAEYEDPDTDTDADSDECAETDVGTDTDEYADAADSDDVDTDTGEYEDFDDADTDADEYEDSDDADTEADEYEDSDDADTDADEYEDSDDADADDDDTDWLLDNLKAQYATKPTQTADTKPQQSRANAVPESFDALMDSDTATDPVQDISLTGEFDRIYNKEQAEKYMEEVEKQPLNIPEKPQKPKKHARD